ncbi:acyltransferase family protein [Flavitalea sp.]|nr:acyltransferase [Flavitalea sp.]
MYPTVNECLLSRKNNFDFIRLVASVGVIFSHSFHLTDNGDDPVTFLSNYHFTLGGLAVMTFFVISGFLITRSFSRTTSLKDYFVARALRIYPALFAVIVLSALVLGPLFTTDSLAGYFTNIKTYKYLTNIFALRIQNSLPGVFHLNPFPDFINGSLWSLPVEMLCYVLVAITGLFIKRKMKFALLLSAAVAVYLYFHPHHIFDDQYYSNIFYFFIGGCFYIFRNRIVISTMTGVLMLLLFILSTRVTEGLGYMVVGGISFSYLIMFLGFVRNSPVENFAKYGDYSYGLYIWAFPVQQILALHFLHWNVYVNFLIATGITLVLSILSWHLIEKKALAFKGSIKRKGQIIPEVEKWLEHKEIVTADNSFLGTR